MVIRRKCCGDIHSRRRSATISSKASTVGNGRHWSVWRVIISGSADTTFLFLFRKLRIRVLQTNGLNHARLFEVRVSARMWDRCRVSLRNCSKSINQLGGLGTPRADQHHPASALCIQPLRSCSNGPQARSNEVSPRWILQSAKELPFPSSGTD